MKHGPSLTDTPIEEEDYRRELQRLVFLMVDQKPFG